MTEIHPKILAIKQAAQAERLRVRSKIREDAEIVYLERKMGERGPTPETNSKVTEHPIEALRRRDYIDDAQERALSDIQDGFQLIAFGARLRMSSPERVDASSGVEEAAARDVDLVADYLEWRRALPDEMCKLCLDCAVEGMSIKRLSIKHQCRWETAKAMLIEGLDEFVTIRVKNGRERNNLKAGTV
jgi:hypothetical protein